MSRVFNFSAGPAALPEAVLRQCAAEMLDWHGSGMSVMEMSHRGPQFIAIAQEAEALLRELLAVPANYKVLFMQGGAIGENAIVPMNLLRGKTRIDFVDTGAWSQKSLQEAGKYGEAHVVASSAATGYDRVPPRGKTLEDLVQVRLGAARLGVLAIAPVDGEDAQRRAHAVRALLSDGVTVAGRRATTPTTMAVYCPRRR